MASAQEPQSTTSTNAPPLPPPSQSDATVSTKSQKSLRRKYQKIRWKFKHQIQASNDLIRDEHRSIALARRLQEQIDELLDLLLDINSETRIPPHLRYELDPGPPSESAIPSLETDQDTDEGVSHSRIREGDSNGVAAKPKSLSYLLETTPHTHHPAENLPEDLVGGDLPGYMTPNHEEEHLLALDSSLLDSSYNPADRSGKPYHLADKNIPSDKELSVRNPDSALNWLRRYQPQVFLQDPKPDHENASEKSAPRAPGPGRGKRKSEAKRPEEEMEEETYVEPVAPSGRGRKSKGGEDDAYRPPKGGRGGKRKRDGDERGARKKQRNSGAAS